MTTTVIVLAFNNGERLTGPCVDSLLAHTDPAVADLLVMDNGSTDGTTDLVRARGVRVETVFPNVGFSNGNNLAAGLVDSDNLVFLNNDIVCHPGWLEPMLEALDGQENVGIVGSKLLYPDGTIQHAGVYFEAPGPLYGLHHHDEQPAGYVPAVTAACMLIRRSLFDRVGGFDPAYRQGNEDVDLCFKVRDAGWHIWYEPESVLTHHESQCEGRFEFVNENVRIFTDRWKDRPELWGTSASRAGVS